MIQSALIFILGVLVAVFVVVLLGPSVWRRAFYLARRQIQAELPLTLTEIRADRDGLRAEHAVSRSRLEQQLRIEREKSSERLIELGQQNEQLKQFATLAGDMDALKEQLRARDADIKSLTAERENFSEKAEILAAEVERLEKHLSSLNELADTLRIELTAKEAEHGRLSNEMSEMRRDRKDASVRYNEVSTQLTAAQTELKSEKRRNTELQQKLEKLISDVSDAQEKLERYSRNGAQLSASDASDVAKENAALREEMALLAARIVAETAAKEGENSPINAMIDRDAPEAAADLSRPKSLASRIRALR